MRVWPGRPYPLGATWDGVGVNVALGVCKIAAASPSERPRTAAREVGSFVGNAAGSAIGMYLVCNAFLGLPTGGSSLIWCGVIAGSIGGVAGSQLGGDLGGGVYSLASRAWSEATKDMGEHTSFALQHMTDW